MVVIGLTGGIGTGKSQVARILEELGAAVIDADIVGHEAYLPETKAWHQVVEAFGEDVLAPSGEVDRKKLGSVVFSDAHALERLNAIMHPRMYEMIQSRIQKLQEDGRNVVVVEAAILIEAKWTPLIDELWITAAAEDGVVQRLQGRSNLQESDIRARIHSQMPQEERLEHADVIIDNAGTLTDLRDRVEKVWHDRMVPH
jgi:dephospho-CoA kinase